MFKKKIKIQFLTLFIILSFTGCQTTKKEMENGKKETVIGEEVIKNKKLTLLEILNKNLNKNRIKKISTTVFYSNDEINKSECVFNYDNLDRLTEIINIYSPYREFEERTHKKLVFYNTETLSSDDIRYKGIDIGKLNRFYVDSSNRKILSKFHADNEDITYELDFLDDSIRLLQTVIHSDNENLYDFAEGFFGYNNENFYIFNIDFFLQVPFRSKYLRFNSIIMLDQIMRLDFGNDGEIEVEKKINTDETGKIISSIFIFDNKELTKTKYYYDDTETLYRIETYLEDNTLLVSRDFEFEQKPSNLNLTYF